MAFASRRTFLAGLGGAAGAGAAGRLRTGAGPADTGPASRRGAQAGRPATEPAEPAAGRPPARRPPAPTSPRRGRGTGAGRQARPREGAGHGQVARVPGRRASSGSRSGPRSSRRRTPACKWEIDAIPELRLLREDLLAGRDQDDRRHGQHPAERDRGAPNKGVIGQPLDDLIAAEKHDLSQYFPSVIKAMTREGKVWGLPYAVAYGPNIFYYNEDLLKSMGVAPPTAEWTVDDLLALAQKATKAPEQWGFRTSGQQRAGHAVLAAHLRRRPLLGRRQEGADLRP